MPVKAGTYRSIGSYDELKKHVDALHDPYGMGETLLAMWKQGRIVAEVDDATGEVYWSASQDG